MYYTYLSAYIPIKATFSKYANELKIEKKIRKPECDLKYLSPKQTCKKNLVSIGL